MISSFTIKIKKTDLIILLVFLSFLLVKDMGYYNMNGTCFKELNLCLLFITD
jgi:hypothetical protein